MSAAGRGDQRTPLRRLTRLEYAYTIQDLLHIDEVIASRLGETLPAEADSGGTIDGIRPPRPRLRASPPP